MKVKDLFPKWPLADVCGSGSSGPYPTNAHEVTIANVLSVLENNVFSNFGHGNETVRYGIGVPNGATAEKVAAILKDHAGENLFTIGEIEVPSD